VTTPTSIAGGPEGGDERRHRSRARRPDASGGRPLRSPGGRGGPERECARFSAPAETRLRSPWPAPSAPARRRPSTAHTCGQLAKSDRRHDHVSLGGATAPTGGDSAGRAGRRARAVRSSTSRSSAPRATPCSTMRRSTPSARFTAAVSRRAAPTPPPRPAAHRLRLPVILVGALSSRPRDRRAVELLPSGRVARRRARPRLPGGAAPRPRDAVPLRGGDRRRRCGGDGLAPALGDARHGLARMAWSAAQIWLLKWLVFTGADSSQPQERSRGRSRPETSTGARGGRAPSGRRPTSGLGAAEVASAAIESVAEN